MKFIFYLLLLLLSACSTAQNLKVIEAIHYTRIGGVKGSRAEVFEIKTRNNSQLNIKYLQIGKVEIPLTKDIKNGMLTLTGTYFPENPEGPQLGEAVVVPFQLNFKDAYLHSENLATKKKSRQKISFSTIDQPIMNNGDVPE
jgi:hypothetical protein